MSRDGKRECLGSRHFRGDIVITDPCYLLHGKGASGDVSDAMAWCSRVGLESRTFYGDWGCTVYRTLNDVWQVDDGDEELGHFTADAGEVCVVPLDEVRKTYPGFESWLDKHRWCGAVIRNFDGLVRLMAQHETRYYDDKPYTDTELRVRGDGLIDGEESMFESIQTEL